MSDTNITTNNVTVDSYNQLGSEYAAHIVGANNATTQASAVGDRYTALTTDNSYLALLAGLQASVTSLEHKTNLEQVHLFTIDLNTRSISAPPEFQDFIGVVGEHKSETLTFQCDRYYDTVDLSRMMIVVEYVNADGQGRVSPILMRDYTTFEDKIIFDWIIDAAMTGTAGIVQFDVRFYMVGAKLEEGGSPLVYSLRTLPYQTKIVDTLPLDMQRFELEYKEQFATELEALLSATRTLEDQISNIHVYWNDLT